MKKEKQNSKKEAPKKVEKDLKQIAIDLYEGRIFSDRQVKNSNDLAMVFMPIALGALSKLSKKDIENIGMIYEYVDKAGPRAINGMPNFFSFRILTKDEMKEVAEYFEQYKKLQENFKKQ